MAALIDLDEVSRELLVAATRPLPEAVGQVVFPVLLVASEIVTDAVLDTLDFMTKWFD